MIKVYSTYHDPSDIYDHFKNNYGSIYMLIQKNHILIKFQNLSFVDEILQTQSITVKGLPLHVYPHDYVPVQKNIFSESMEDLNDAGLEMDIEQNLTDDLQMVIEEKGALVNSMKIKLKKLNLIYDEKINQIKQLFVESEICHFKISEFNKFYQRQLKRNKKPILSLFNTIINNVRQYNFNTINKPIDLQPNLFPSHSFLNDQKKEITSHNFYEKLIYANPQKNQIKRLYSLNENDFICTQKFPIKGENRGFLRIYRKKQTAPKYSIEIQQGPYSLLCMDNFILTGDYSGHIHFIDIENQNSIQYSNRLSSGLIFQMQKYGNSQMNQNILTLSLGQFNSYKIKKLQIQKQAINQNVNSLMFHPKEQLICQNVTMTMDVLGNGRFVYGSERNTYICSGFDLYSREHIAHEHNVMKVKKYDTNKIIQATLKKVYLTDLNNRKFQKQFASKYEINTFEKLNDNLVFIGGRNGQVAVIDFRNTNQVVWSPSLQMNSHMGKISDIMLIGDSVITCDSGGVICEWKNQPI